MNGFLLCKYLFNFLLAHAVYELQGSTEKFVCRPRTGKNRKHFRHAAFHLHVVIAAGLMASRGEKSFASENFLKTEPETEEMDFHKSLRCESQGNGAFSNARLVSPLPPPTRSTLIPYLSTARAVHP